MRRDFASYLNEKKYAMYDPLEEIRKKKEKKS